MTANNYAALERVLDDALRQSRDGKGAKRHADGRPWEDQPLMRISCIVGTGFVHGQALKKLGEAAGMIERGELHAAREEVLGAIVYAAALAHLLVQKMSAATEIAEGVDALVPFGK